MTPSFNVDQWFRDNPGHSAVVVSSQGSGAAANVTYTVRVRLAGSTKEIAGVRPIPPWHPSAVDILPASPGTPVTVIRQGSRMSFWFYEIADVGECPGTG